MMEMFLHSTSVAHVSGPNTSETLPPLGFIVSIVSRFHVVISDFFFGQIFFNSYEVSPCKIMVAIRGH